MTQIFEQRANTWLFALVMVALVAISERTAGATERPEMRRLKNQLSVLVIPNPAQPIATVELAVRNTAFGEMPGLLDLSHLYEHMFLRGNATLPDQQAFKARLRELGAVFDATTNAELVNYYLTLPAQNLPQGLKFMADAARTTQIDPVVLEREKKVVFGEFDRSESNPYSRLSQRVNNALWCDESPGCTDPMGRRNHVASATIEQMEWVKTRLYMPENALLIIAGDVSIKRGFALAEDYFDVWAVGETPHKAPNSGQKAISSKSPLPKPMANSRYIIAEHDTTHPYLQLSWHAPDASTPPTTRLAAHVLGFLLTQADGPFQKHLAASGVIQGAGATNFYAQHHLGPLLVYAQISPDSLETAFQTIFAEVQKLGDSAYFSETQLQIAKAKMATHSVYAYEKPSHFAHLASLYWATAGLDNLLNYRENLDQITRDD